METGALVELRALLGPPPNEPYRVAWEAVREQVGSPLPPEFVAFVDEYGVGAVGEIAILIPEQGGYLVEVVKQYDWIRYCRDGGDTDASFTMFPEFGGLIPVATDGGSYWYWRPDCPDPSRWSLVRHEPGEPDVEPEDRSVIELLLDAAKAAVATGKQLSYPLDPPSDEDCVWLAAPARVDPADLVEFAAEPRPGDLPSDYLALMDRYGPGAYGGVLRIHPPDEIDVRTEAARVELASDRPERPHVHPEPGGLLVWGRFANGVLACWAPAWTTPDGWPVVLVTGDGGWQRLPYTLTGFLRRWLNDELPLALPDLRPRDAAFVPVQGDPIHLEMKSTGDVVEQAPPFCAELALLVGPRTYHQAVDWEPIHEALGIELPSDFQWFVERYGPGAFTRDFTVPGPSDNKYRDIVARYQQNIMRDFGVMDGDVLRERDGTEREIELYPDADGLLQWAYDGDGNSHWWDTAKGDPDSWTVVALRHESSDWKGTPYRTAEYLVRYLTNRLPESPMFGTITTPPVWIPEHDKRRRDGTFHWEA